MTTPMPTVAASYINATNNKDAGAFLALFAPDAVVDDNGRQHAGLDAIREWSQREIFDANVTLEVLEARGNDAEAVVTTKVDGDFDRTGLPDPVIIDHQMLFSNKQIRQLSCRLSRQA